MKCEGASSDVRAERDKPSSWSDGGGNDGGGGVAGRGGGTGEEARDAASDFTAGSED